MTLEASNMLGAIVIGVGATLVMDLWNLFLKRRFGIRSLNYCLLGRWVRHLMDGTFRHASIAAAPEQPAECTVGWIAHYTIGVVLALGLIGLTSGAWLTQPTLLPALLYGIATVVFPFLILQPSFGLGIASSRTPKPIQARLKSLMTHAVFGLGLYVSALGVTYLPRVPAQPEPTAARENSSGVSTLVARYDSAWGRRDTSAVSRLLAPRYQYFTSLGGVSSRAETLAMLGSPEYRLEQAERSEIVVSRTGPVAIVSSRWTGRGTYRGEPFNDDQRCGQTWLQADRTWQLVSEHCVQIAPAGGS